MQVFEMAQKCLTQLHWTKEVRPVMQIFGMAYSGLARLHWAAEEVCDADAGHSMPRLCWFDSAALGHRRDLSDADV